MDNNSIIYRRSISRDLQRVNGTNAEYTLTSPQSVKSLNKEMKEPIEIVLFSGGIYECTLNDKRDRYNQSQLAFLLDAPIQESVDRFHAILY